jgi:L-threonylcarbamoyladenylate synthase
MKKFQKNSLHQILLNDGVGILPTDTLYGLVGRAFSRKAFDRIFELKKRDAGSPFIILISSIEDLRLFDIEVDNNTKKILEKYWPGKVSVILPCNSENLSHLHLGTKTLAFRMPDKKDLLKLLKLTGPLLAPSANHPGEKPALMIEEARAYFSNDADFYADEGKLESLPSTLIKIENGKIIVLREGAVAIN